MTRREGERTNARIAASRRFPVSESVSTWRVFCAIELPDHVRSQLAHHVALLRQAIPDASASWSRPENVHLTLKFFGNVSTQNLSSISAAAARVIEGFSPFQIKIGKTGVFPRPSRPQVLWIGVEDPSGRLSALQSRLEEECAREGFAKEDRAYRPHLTIARIRRPEGARQLAESHLQTNFSSTEVSVTEFLLFRSELGPKGSRYTAISKHALT